MPLNYCNSLLLILLPVWVLLPCLQETDRPTFKEQSQLFLKNWICAGNAANYTGHGRAYNPMSGGFRLGSKSVTD